MPRSTRSALSDSERAERRRADRELARQAVEQLRSSTGWQRWLTSRRHFHSYSLANQLLIARAMPEATRVAGFQDLAEARSFSTHTLRHLCLTDLARSGWELHAIATFAGHRSTQTTMQYIHLSGRDLAARLEGAMNSVHAQRVAQLGQVLGS